MKSVLSALFVLAFLGSAAIAASHGAAIEALQNMLTDQQIEVAIPAEATEDQLAEIQAILAGSEDAAEKTAKVKAVLGM
jgi:hypothetical protein